MGEEPGEIRGQIEETRERLGDTVSALADKTNVKRRVKRRAAKTKEALAGTKDAAVSRASRAREAARSRAEKAKENPLGLAVAALAGGVLVGLALPRTRAEDERVGPIADDVKRKAKETGREALERGKNVAEEAAQRGKEVVQETSQAAKRSTKSAAKSVKETGKRQAKTVGKSARNKAKSTAGSRSRSTR